MKNVFTYIILGLLLFSSCSSNSSCDDSNFIALSDEVGAASTTYSNNATDENCKAYVAAINKFNAELKDCPDWSANVESWNIIKGTLPCN